MPSSWLDFFGIQERFSGNVINYLPGMSGVDTSRLYDYSVGDVPILTFVLLGMTAVTLGAVTMKDKSDSSSTNKNKESKSTNPSENSPVEKENSIEQNSTPEKEPVAENMKMEEQTTGGKNKKNKKHNTKKLHKKISHRKGKK
jgi:type III secretory pathway component EscV